MCRTSLPSETIACTRRGIVVTKNHSTFLLIHMKNLTNELTLFQINGNAKTCVFIFKSKIKLRLSSLFGLVMASYVAHTNLIWMKWYTFTYFEITSWEVKSFVEVLFKQDKTQKPIILSKPNYVRKIRKCFHMEDCDPKLGPTDTYTNISSHNSLDDGALVDRQLYQKAIGSLMFLMACTRPDITFVSWQIQFSFSFASDFQVHSRYWLHEHYKAKVRTIVLENYEISGTSDRTMCDGSTLESISRFSWNDSSQILEIADDDVCP